MAEITLKTSRPCEIVDITGLVGQTVPETLDTGICHIYCPHTTAGVTVNENADPDVKRDMLAKLDRLAPRHEEYYRHAEGNSDGHLKATLVGFSLAVPVRRGRLELGAWQGIYFCEFDGPRTRRVRVYFQEATA